MKNDKTNKVIARVAPSPTGYLHIGTARAALFNFLFAKKYGGTFILRIEDTDKERNKKEFEENIIDSLLWLGLSWNLIYKQSERTDIYKKYLKKLVDEGKAYISKEKIKKEGDREEVIRFRNPNKKIKFADLVRGNIEFDTTDLGDFVIAKSSEEPLYHLAVVVDDFEMGITHVIRGED
ncbi:MAG: glutamate--tRNA ligase family protein, partial [Patescibacteria group bacterium]